MKYSHYCFLAAAVASSFFSYTALGEAQTQLGPHSGQKFVLIKHIGGLRQADVSNKLSPQTLAIVLTIEQKMNGKEQEISAKVEARQDGPKGALVGVDGLTVHVTQPADFGTKPTIKSAGAHITHTLPASGGKYKTVVAEARFDSPDYASAVVNLTIPGDK